MYMRADEEPFNDNRVRKALKYTIDEEGILRAAYGLLYDKVKDVVSVQEHPIAPIYPVYTELEKREQNIEKAKELLAEAGYPDGIDLTLYYASNYRVGPEAAIALQQMARPAGFNIQLAGFPRDVYLSKYWGNVNFGITGWGNRADIVNLLKLAYTSDAPWSESAYSNPEIDELVDKIALETDKEKRKELVYQLEKIFKEDGAVVIINMGRWHGLGEGVEGFKEASTFIGDWRDVTVNN
jgi:peptide/nickel transport system substrate-binding protein